MRYFYYRLAKELGIIHVDDMLDKLSSTELNGWIAFYIAEAEIAEEAQKKNNVKQSAAEQTF